MKKILLFVCASFLLTQFGFGQAQVIIFNTHDTLISIQPLNSPLRTMPGRDEQTFYFGLFTAPQGTTDPSSFVFSGLYATNHAFVTGRISGGPIAEVPGWMPGQYRAALIRGWSDDLGHDWNPLWLEGGSLAWSSQFYFGESPIIPGLLGGGFNGIGLIPAAQVFGQGGLQQGFTLFQVPEPAALGWLALSAGAFLARRRKNVGDGQKIFC